MRFFAGDLRLASIVLAGAVLASAGEQAPNGLTFAFTEIAARAGLTAATVYGGVRSNRFLLETTGSGVAALDYDNDGWLDALLRQRHDARRFPEGQGADQSPVPQQARRHVRGCHRRSRPGTQRMGTGRVRRRLRQRRLRRSVRHVLGHEPPVSQSRRRDVRGRHRHAAGLEATRVRWGAGCAFLDYDRDGSLDLFAANYIDFDLATSPVPESGLCRYKGLPVACGPPGLPGGKNILYRNPGDGTFADVSDGRHHRARMAPTALASARSTSTTTGGSICMSRTTRTRARCTATIATAPSRTSASTAGCAYSQDGKPQAGMGVAVGDYNRDGTMDIFKTNFAGDTSTLYANNGNGLCEDRTFASGFGRNTRWLGWGVAFLDLDLDGWLDLFLVNGHVYPEVEQLKTRGRLPAAQGRVPQPRRRAIRRRDRAAGTARDRCRKPGAARHSPTSTTTATSTSLVNNIHDTPELYRLDQRQPRTWAALQLVGTSRPIAAPSAHASSSPPVARRRWRGARRRQLLLAERPARALRAGRGGSHRSRRSALAERPGRTVDRRRDQPFVTLTEGTGRPVTDKPGQR